MSTQPSEWSTQMAQSVRHAYRSKKRKRLKLVALNLLVISGLFIGGLLPANAATDPEALLLESFISDQVTMSVELLDSDYADVTGAYW